MPLASRRNGRARSARFGHGGAAALALAVLTTSLLTACGSTKDAASSDSSSTPTSTSSEAAAALNAVVAAAHDGTGTTSDICLNGDYKIGIDIYPSTIAFGQDVISGAKDIAKSTGCVTPVILEDNLKAETVLANMKSFIQQKVDGIALLNAVEAPEDAAIKLAKDAGIPIVTASLGRPGTPFIDVDNGEAGKAEGTAVATAFKDQAGSKTPWIMISNFPLTPPASDRVTGWLEGVKSVFPDIPKSQILSFNGQLNPAVTTQMAKPLIARIPKDDPVLTVGINDDAGFALAKLIHDSGHPMAGSGFGGDHTDQPNVCTGFYNTSGWFPEKSMAYIYPALIAMKHGATFPDVVNQKTEVLTKDTVNEFYPGTC